MKTCIICGDSFMSPVTSFPGKHFSEIFTNALDFNLQVYARSGMSNGGIMVQLLSAIEKKPDLIIFNTTSPERIEFPTKNNSTLPWYSVENLLYNSPFQYKSDESDQWMNKDVRIQSQSLLSLLRKHEYNPSQDPYYNHSAELYNMIDDLDDKMKVAKLYFEYLFDPTIKLMSDTFMMYGVITWLNKSNIPYMFVHNALPIERFFYESYMNPKYWLADTIGPLVNQGRIDPKYDPGFHTTFEAQEKIAKFLIYYYKNNFNTEIPQ